MASQTINTIHPMIGIRPTSSHQPLFPMSCMRRTPSAIPGMNVAIPKSDCSRSPGKKTSSTPAAALAISVKSTNHQYSDRLARPENCAYATVVMFRFTDCTNSI